MGQAYSQNVGDKNSSKILIGKHFGKRTLGRPRRRQGDIRMYLREIVCEGEGWMELAKDHVQW